jgi:flagellar hook-associated protein 2
MAVNPVSGLFSGIDTASIVSKLMAVEKKPLYVLQRKKAVYDKQISSYGDLLSKLSALKESLSFFKTNTNIPISAASSNVSMLSVSAASEASAGVYDIEIKQLARAHRVISNSGAASESTAVVTGADKYFKFKLGESGVVQEIALTDGMTLLELKNAINSKNAGVTASIINTGTGENPYKLVISSNTTGASKNIIITQDDTIFANLYSDVQQAQNAIFKVNGVEVQRSSNTVSDVITGVTLTLSKADANYGTANATPVTVTLSQDTSLLKNKLNIFAAQYNAFVTAAKGLSAKGQSLATDTSVDSIINTLRGVTTNKYNDTMLVNFGLTHDRNGVLQVNDSAFASALNNSSTDVLNALKAMSESFDAALNNIINNSIPSKRDGLRESIKRIEKSQANLEIRLTKKEESLNKKFSLLEQTISSMQSRGDYLLQQLSKMSNNK